MLRILLAALLAANAGFFAWSQGWLDGVVGARSIGDREPERMTRQVHADQVRVLPPAPASAAASASTADSPASAASTPVAQAAAPTAICLEAGPFSDGDLTRVQALVKASLTEAVVSDQKSIKPGRYLVYMGPYPSRDALTKKEDELKRRKLNFTEVLDIPAYTPGLSLGRYGDRATAARALDQFVTQDIHTARVIELAPPATSHLLHLETTDVAIAGRAAGLKLGAATKGFAPCNATNAKA